MKYCLPGIFQFTSLVVCIFCFDLFCLDSCSHINWANTNFWCLLVLQHASQRIRYFHAHSQFYLLTGDGILDKGTIIKGVVCVVSWSYCLFHGSQAFKGVESEKKYLHEPIISHGIIVSITPPISLFLPKLQVYTCSLVALVIGWTST